MNVASLKIFNGDGIAAELEGVREFIKVQDLPSEFSIHNEKLSVTFRPDGLMKAVTLKSTDFTVPVHLNFIKYVIREKSWKYESKVTLKFSVGICAVEAK